MHDTCIVSLLHYVYHLPDNMATTSWRKLNTNLVYSWAPKLGYRLFLVPVCRTYVIFFSKTDGVPLLLKIVGPIRAAIRRKVQVRKVREKPGGRLFTTFTDVLRPLTSLEVPAPPSHGGTWPTSSRNA